MPEIKKWTLLKDKLQQGDYGVNTMRTRNMNIETDYVKKWINGTVPYVISTNICMQKSIS